LKKFRGVSRPIGPPSDTVLMYYVIASGHHIIVHPFSTKALQDILSNTS